MYIIIIIYFFSYISCICMQYAILQYEQPDTSATGMYLRHDFLHETSENKALKALPSQLFFVSL